MSSLRSESEFGSHLPDQIRPSVCAECLRGVQDAYRRNQCQPATIASPATASTSWCLLATAVSARESWDGPLLSYYWGVSVVGTLQEAHLPPRRFLQYNQEQKRNWTHGRAGCCASHQLRRGWPAAPGGNTLPLLEQMLRGTPASFSRFPPILSPRNFRSARRVPLQRKLVGFSCSFAPILRLSAHYRGHRVAMIAINIFIICGRPFTTAQSRE